MLIVFAVEILFSCSSATEKKTKRDGMTAVLDSCR